MKKQLFILLFLPLLIKAQRNDVSRLDGFMQAEVAAGRFNGNCPCCTIWKGYLPKAIWL
jgi:hypothetical protein